MLKCTKCNVVKPKLDFSRSSSPRLYAYRCKQCDKDYRDAHKHEIKDYQFKKKYGISLEKYKQLDKAQNSLCAICNKPCSSGRKLAVDHCHTTLNVRALLCINCNQGLGSFKDNPDLLNKAIQYLKKYN